MKTTLEIVRAGAGSGKTTDLCETVAVAVLGGLDASRILATTFTKKAAAELKGRIQARLLSGLDGDTAVAHRQADRLDLAAIGTIHSVAHRLLSRYAISLGLSPRLKVLTQVSQAQALGDLLGAMPVNDWQKLTVSAERLAVTDLQERILKLLSAKRGNRISDELFRQQMRASADRVCKLLAPDGAATITDPVDHLLRLVEDALVNIEKLTNDTTGVTKTACQQLRRLKAQPKPTWSSYLQAKKLAAGKKSGADGMLDSLRTHASQIRLNPGLHADVRDFAACLADQTIWLGSQFDEYKTKRGLVDFTDLEILFLELLENADLTASLSEDFDLILVDEFQDTNPLQLAIFQRLRQLAPRSRWVGDPKQAIYGFRETDPDLINDVWKAATDAQRNELPDNYRSQRGLVQLVGQLFFPVFGKEAIQNPKKPASPKGVERWILESENQTQDADALACGILKLHSEGIRFGDMAVLERVNRRLNGLARALDSLGIPYLLDSPGLLATREGVLVLAGLRLVSDRSDSLAAATILHILGDPNLETPEWLHERLTAVQATPPTDDTAEPSEFVMPWNGDARLSAMERIDRRTLAPLLVVQQAIEALGVPSLVQKWGEPARRCSNLDSLIQHARDYEELARETGGAVTLTGLILYFEKLASDKMDVRYPPLGHDAVTLTTYHSAKGLEWPVVILSGLDSDRDAEMWSPVVTGGNPSEGDPLEGRILRAWTWPFGFTDGEFPKMVTGSGLEDDALVSPEGQERTQRAQQESLRLLYVGCTRAKTKLVFVHRPDKYEWLKRLDLVDSVLDCSQGAGEHTLDGIDTTFVVRPLNADMMASCRLPTATSERWLAPPKGSTITPSEPRFHQPSRLSASTGRAAFRIQELTGSPHFPTGAKEDQYSAIGDAVHAYFAALPSLHALTSVQKEAVAERCMAAYSVTGLLTPAVIVSAGERFCAWVESQYPGACWLTETPVTVPRLAGGQWKGTLDLLLQLTDGDLVIIDHKSAPLRREHCAAKAASYSGQLSAYQEMIRGAGQSIRSTWIHFPLAGVVAEFVQPGEAAK